jgi:hypothetical protein
VDGVAFPGGGFALLDVARECCEHASVRVVSYAPDGALREDRLLGKHLPDALGLDAGGDWLVVGVREPPALLLSRRSTGELFTLRLSALAAGGSWRFEVAGDGRELRLVELEHGTFLRLALP